MRRLLFSLIPLFLSAFVAAQAKAETDRFVCSDSGTRDGRLLYFDRHESFTVKLMRVKASRRKVHFVRDNQGRPSGPCPGSAKECQMPSYVVAGDIVITTGIEGKHVCAIYVDPTTGVLSNNYLPLAALIDMRASPLERADWSGRWLRVDLGVDQRPQHAAQIRIVPQGNATYRIHGSSSYADIHAVQTKRNALVSEYDVIVSPVQGEMQFSIGPDGKARAIQDMRRDGNSDCMVLMKRFGPYLLEHDDQIGCGEGPPFSGVFRRSE
jgi:hypothetical protein